MPMPIPALIPPPFRRPQITPKPVVSTTSYSDPLRAMTIKALQERQQALQQDVPQMPSMLSPWQGVSYALDKFMHGLQEGRTQRAEIAAEQGRAALMGQIDPTTGATEQQIGQMGQYDPEMMTTLWADRAKRAQADQWIDIPPPPGAPPGTLWQRNKANGDVQEIGGRGGGVNVTLPGESTGLERYTSEAESKIYGGIMEAGMKAIGQQQDVAALDALINSGMPQGGIPGALLQAYPALQGFSSGAAALQSIVSRLAPTLRVTGSGSQSDFETDSLLRSLPRLGNMPEANRFIVQMMKDKAKLNMTMYDVVMKWRNKQIDETTMRMALDHLYGQSVMSPELHAIINKIEQEQQPGGGGAKPASEMSIEEIQQELERRKRGAQ
jgi:hypothetical protein